MRKLKLVLLIGLIALTGGLAGCGSGSDGAPGVNGVNGASGAEVTVQDLANLGLVYSGDVVAINPTLDLSQTVAYNATTGALTVHFFLKDEAGAGIDVTKLPYELRLYVSELIPADATVTDNPGPAWNQLISERGTPAAGSPMPGTLTLVDAATGEYNYVAAATLAATTNVTRVTVRARFRFNDLNGARVVVANPVNASYDFLQSNPGTPLASSGADMVTTAACETCHGARIGDVGHGGGYTQVKTCNNCHNVNYMATRTLEADLAFMIHRIHNAGTFVGLTDHSNVPLSFADVTYPQEITTCSKCHDGADASLAYSNPTRSNCGACHSDVNFTKPGSTVATPVDFATGVNHPGGIQTTDSNCATCHNAANIQNVYHSQPPAPADTPEFAVTITMSDPANKAAQIALGELPYYVAGEAPVVTVTLADSVGPVVGTVYTADADAKGVTGGALSGANLYVYGPRAHAVPVLKAHEVIGDVDANLVMIGNDDGICDPAEALIPGACTSAQGNSLLLTGGVSTDTLVTTTASGYSYQLTPIPADLAPGTYMVRFEGYDYGAISATDYVTSSNTVINFQVGSATIEPKVSGDACITCHGDTRMHLQGAHPHNAAFNTDACLGCHDFSGGYGDYIGNRVHAVHRASVTGDGISNHPTDWSHVTFPRPANNCTTCHTNAVATPVWRTPTMLACGGCHGTLPLAVAADYPTADPTQVMTEAAAAQHMEQNGGSTSPTATPTLSCLVCHGEGRTADLFVTHKLIQFRPLPVDPNQ